MTALLLLVTDQHRDRDELVDELLALHQLACELRARLDTAPRWRPRRRANIDRVLREVCRQADLVRAAIGARGSCGMYELLERTARQQAKATR